MFLDRYAYLNNYTVQQSPSKVVESIPPVLGINLRMDATLITSSEGEKLVNTVLLVHDRSQYRKKTSSINLVPETHILLEKLLDKEELKCKPILFSEYQKREAL